MIRIMIFFLLGLLVIFLIQDSWTSTESRKVLVDKIFVGDSCQYTVLEHKSNSLTTFGGYVPRVVQDVSRNHKCWIVFEDCTSNGVMSKNHDLKLLEIHIHNPTDLSPGGWNYGKFGSGINAELN